MSVPMYLQPAANALSAESIPYGIEDLAGGFYALRVDMPDHLILITDDEELSDYGDGLDYSHVIYAVAVFNRATVDANGIDWGDRLEGATFCSSDIGPWILSVRAALEA